MFCFRFFFLSIFNLPLLELRNLYVGRLIFYFFVKGKKKKLLSTPTMCLFTIVSARISVIIIYKFAIPNSFSQHRNIFDNIFNKPRWINSPLMAFIVTKESIYIMTCSICIHMILTITSLMANVSTGKTLRFPIFLLIVHRTSPMLTLQT